MLALIVLVFLTMATTLKKISKCRNARCGTCCFLMECDSFQSSVTGRRFTPILGTYRTLNCSTCNIVYLAYCKICAIQYVGETKNSLKERFRGHKASIISGNSNQLIHQHFFRDCHGLHNLVIIPIEKIECTNASDQTLTKIRKEKEAYWQRMLQTMYPLGLNIRLKGVGDFHPSQAMYLRFGYKRRLIRTHGRRKPKSQRVVHNVDIPFLLTLHNNLMNSPRYTHYLKTYLYSIPRYQLSNISNDLPNHPNLDTLIKDMINLIAGLRLFSPVQVKEKLKREFFHLPFIDKGLDFINLSGILRSKEVVSKIPIYFQNKEPPVIGYRYNKGIANKLFNYKQSLTQDSIKSIQDSNYACNCNSSPFKETNSNHVITGNLDIVQNGILRQLIRKGPKYRLPRKINWEKNRENVKNFLDSYIESWLKKENKAISNNAYDLNLLSDWKNQVLQFVDNRIQKGRRSLKKTFHFNFNVVSQELERLHDLYVMTPADKAANNVIFTCKSYYVKSIRDELLASNTYQLVRSSRNSINSINTAIKDFTNKFGLNVPDEMLDIPLIYFIQKMHKNPFSKRFIAGSRKCSIKIISKSFSKCSKLMVNHFRRYDKTVFERTGLKYFWIIDNSLDFLDNIKNLNTDFMESYDFSTLYTNLPHNEIKIAFQKLFSTVFARESKMFINVSSRKAFFSDRPTRGYVSLRETDLYEILCFILDNIYVKFGTELAKQKIGIPIGLDSGQDIANLLLYYYESEYLRNLAINDLNEAKKFCYSFRYIDDLLSAAFRNFSNHLAQIYPRALVLNKSNNDDTQVDYLDIRIKSQNNSLGFSLYDKRDAFNFEVVNFPYLDSCIPRKPALGTFFGQLIRFARICSKYSDFCERSKTLSKRLLNQGFKYNELSRLASRFFKERSDLITKYNERNVISFINNVLFKN